MSQTPLHPAMKLSRPSLYLGGVLLLLGGAVYRGWLPLEPATIWTIVLAVFGLGFFLFGLTVIGAGRMLAGIVAAQQAERSEDQGPAPKD